MKGKKQKKALVAYNEESETPASRSQAISELFKAAGIKSRDETEENLGKTSAMFINSPSQESQDKAATALRYHNQRKGAILLAKKFEQNTIVFGLLGKPAELLITPPVI